MKSFNKTIQIEVSVDTIAQKLLSTINPDEKHRDAIAETIIGSLLNNRNSQKSLGMIYNSLTGFSNDINFKVGDIVNCKDKTYKYILQNDKSYSHDYVEIGEATVVDIDIYKDDKLQIQFETLNSKGETFIDKIWVNHTKCNLIPLNVVS